MLLVSLCAVALLVLSTVIHYESLRGMSFALPRLAIPVRMKLVLVILGAFIAHASHMLLYALAFFWLSRHPGLGTLGSTGLPSLATCLYFSAETYTSLGYGDVVPSGPVRLLAGMETLNGLLLIGWTASYTYLSMERFWVDDGKHTG
jgi:hypothetical protein